MYRKQFTFYRSFWEATQALPKRDQQPFLLALIVYALDGEAVPLNGPAASAFCIVKPILDNARRKAESGKEGGSKPRQNASKSKQNEADRKLLPQTGKQEQGQGQGQEQGQEQEQEQVQDKDEDEDPCSPLAGESVAVGVAGALGELSERQKAELNGFLDSMGGACVIRAINAAQDAGKPTWAYVRGILQRKLAQGVRCAGDWDKAEARFQNAKSRKGAAISGTPRDVQPSPERARQSADWLENFLSGKECQT